MPAAGEPVPGGGNTLFLRVFDEGEATVTDENAATSDVLWFQVDGRVYGTETTEDYSTTLIELTAEGGPRAALTAPGFVHGVARVR